MNPSSDGPGATVPETKHQKRDAETLAALGLFVTFLSLPVLLGTFWAENYRQTVVNGVAGLVLLAIGIALLYWSRKTARRGRRS